MPPQAPPKPAETKQEGKTEPSKEDPTKPRETQATGKAATTQQPVQVPSAQPATPQKPTQTPPSPKTEETASPQPPKVQEPLKPTTTPPSSSQPVPPQPVIPPKPAAVPLSSTGETGKTATPKAQEPLPSPPKPTVVPPTDTPKAEIKQESSSSSVSEAQKTAPSAAQPTPSKPQESSSSQQTKSTESSPSKTGTESSKQAVPPTKTTEDTRATEPPKQQEDTGEAKIPINTGSRSFSATQKEASTHTEKTPSPKTAAQGNQPITQAFSRFFARFLPAKRPSLENYIDLPKLIQKCEAAGPVLASYIGTGLLSAFTVAIFLVLGVLKVVINLKGAFLNGLMAFGSGALLGEVFMHILPDATMSEMGRFTVIAGIFLFFMLDKLLNREIASEKGKEEAEEDFLAGEEKQAEEEKREKMQKKGKGKGKAQEKPKNKPAPVVQAPATAVQSPDSVFLYLLAAALHKCLYGMAIAVAFQQKAALGLTTTLAISLHEVPHSLAAFVVLIRAGKGLGRALVLQIATGLVAVMGTYLALADFSKEKVEEWALPLVTGNFLYLALTGMLGGLRTATSWGSLLMEIGGFLAGASLMLFLALVE